MGWWALVPAVAMGQEDPWRLACARATAGDARDGAVEPAAEGWIVRCGGHTWPVAALPADEQGRIELLWVLLAAAREGGGGLGLPPPVRRPPAPAPVRAVASPAPAPAPPPAPVIAPGPVAALPAEPAPLEEEDLADLDLELLPAPEAAPPPAAAVPARRLAVALEGWEALAPAVGSRRAAGVAVRLPQGAARVALGRTGPLVPGSRGYVSTVDLSAGPAAEIGWVRLQWSVVASFRTAHDVGAVSSAWIPGTSADVTVTVPVSPDLHLAFGLRGDGDLRRTVVREPEVVWVAPVAVGAIAAVVLPVGGAP